MAATTTFCFPSHSLRRGPDKILLADQQVRGKTLSGYSQGAESDVVYVLTRSAPGLAVRAALDSSDLGLHAASKVVHLEDPRHCLFKSILNI